MKDDGYCGLSCTELLEKQQEILDLCIEHAKYDPEFAPKMVQRLIDKCNETKTELMSEIIQARYRSSSSSSTVH